LLVGPDDAVEGLDRHQPSVLVVHLEEPGQGVRGQHHVRVEEQQQFPTGRAGADVTGPGLARPAGFGDTVTHDDVGSGGACDRRGGVPGVVVDHDDIANLHREPAAGNPAAPAACSPRPERG
jgi:hypothetical protein